MKNQISTCTQPLLAQKKSEGKRRGRKLERDISVKSGKGREER